MIKVKDGYAKLIGTTYEGSSTNVLLSNGGNFPIHSNRNNEANKLVRTDSNGFLQTGWINTTSGDMGTGTITKIYCSNDDYIRYKTPANFFSSLTNSGNNISITVAGLNRTLQVGYASNSEYTGITWTSNTKVGSYSKLCRISYYANVLLSVNLSLNSLASNHLFLISTGYGSANIIQLGANNYSGNSSVKMRVTRSDSTHFDVELLNSYGYNNAEYLSVGCKAIKCDNECSITTYTSYTAGSGTVKKEITSSYNSIVTNLTGNATTASQLLTPRTLWGRSFNGTANVTGSLSSVEDINMSGVMKSSKETSTYIAGNLGNALINSTAPAGRYVMLFRGVSTDGYFTHGVYLKSYLLQYTAKSTVDEGSNSVTKSATLLDESGNSAFPGYITSTGFVKSGSSDSYVLLGGGGHKAVSDFATASSLNNYVTLTTSQTISGVKTFSTLLKFTVGSGTAPFTVSSNTLVTNLNADMLDNYHETAFPRLVGIKGNTWNWNDVIRAGYYKIQSGTITNHPSGIYPYGMAEVITTENHNDGENRELQIYYPHSQTNNIAIWLRMHNSPTQGSGWGSWVGVPNTNGNIASASRLQTARKINGTSFNGTADITTSYWGSTRTLTIGNTGKSVNGSGNVSWSLSEIGAASSSHTHNYITMYRAISQLDSDDFSTYVKNYAKGVTAISNVTATVGNIAATATVLNVGHSTTRFWRIFSSRGTNAAIFFQGPNSDGTGWDTKLKLLTSANSYVSKSGETLTVTINGVTQSLTNTNTTNTTGSSNTSSKIFLIGATSQSSAVQTYSHDTAYVGTDGCLYSNKTKVSVEGHTHGTLHSTFTTKLNNTTTDSGWSMINSSYNGFLLKSIRTQSSAPNWIESNYAAGICFGGEDTKGVLSMAYNSPAIKFAGGNGTKPVWWIRLLGASGATYNLANMWTGTRYWANIAVSTSSSTSTSPTFSSCYTSNWFRSEGKTGWYSQTYGGGWYMTDSTWLRSFNNKGVVAKCFYASDWSSSTYLLRSDGGAAAFHWSGQSGQPSWVWGGNNLHQYYVYNPSNFSVNYAKSAGNADTLDGLHSTHYFRKYNRSDMGSSMNLNTLKTFGIFEVRTSEITTTNSPMSGYYPLLNFVNGEHVLIQIAGTTGNLFYRATQTANVGTSAEFTPSWAAFIDNTNYTSYIKKIGTSTVGGTDRPIYLSSGTPTPISSTKGSASLPVYLNAGTITACTPSSVFSNLSNSGTKLSISVAGQNRTLTVMYATSTLYVVSSGRQTALSGTTAANSGIRLYEAYNNGYPISYGNLLSMKGRGSTELLMGWKSGANRMYYRSNSDINEGWTGWSTVATLADISNAVKTGTTGHLAYYSSTSSISSFNSNVGNPYTPIYLSSGVPKPCNGVIFKSIGKYLFTYTNSATNPGTGSYTYTQSGYNYPNIIKVSVNTTGSITIEFNRSIMNAIIGGNGVGSILSPDGNRYGGYISIGFKSGDTSVDVITKNESGRLTVSFYLYVMEF